MLLLFVLTVREVDGSGSAGAPKPKSSKTPPLIAGPN